VKRRIRYAQRARVDLDAIRRWLTQPGVRVRASRRLIAIRTAINRLRDHPCRHPIGRNPSVRELACSRGYRVFYSLTPDTGRDETAGDVLILRVFGPGQSRDRL
jgi:plasmid stabilization system protein ParE